MTQILPLSRISFDELLEVFNKSFEDYISPFSTSKEQLLTKLRLDKIDYEVSFGIYQKSKLIGFILHSLNKENNTAYNAGTGIILEERNKGHLSNAYNIIKPILKQNNVQYLIHEVRTKNEIAINAYKKNGFEIKRELAIYSGIISEIVTNNSCEIFKSEILNNSNSLIQDYDYKPSWLNSLEHIDLSTLEVYTAKENENVIGQVIYYPLSKRLVQIYVDKGHRRKKVGTNLILHLKKTNQKLSVFNTPYNEQTKSFFESIGLTLKFTQYEMWQKI